MKYRFLLPLFLLTLLVACSDEKKVLPEADVVYVGGDILTMVGDTPEYVEAVSIKDGKVLVLGAKEDVLEFGTKKTVDLAGKTLMPGFYNTHSHFYQAAIKLSAVNLDAPPSGYIDSIPSIQQALRGELGIVGPLGEGDWLYGWGYDDTKLRDGRDLVQSDLDRVSSDVAVAVFHGSKHQVVLNSAALKVLGIKSDDVTVRNGVLKDLDLSPVIDRLLARVQNQQMQNYLVDAQLLYAQLGYTTLLDVVADSGAVVLMESFVKQGKLTLDLLVIAQEHVENIEKLKISNQHNFTLLDESAKLNDRTAGLYDKYQSGFEWPITPVSPLLSLQGDRYKALHAITQQAAWQFYEEAEKGSLVPGKYADLVILDANPLKVSDDKLQQVSVIETIKQGQTVWLKAK